MTEVVQTFIEHLIQASPLALLGGRRVLHTPPHSRGVAGSHGRRIAGLLQLKYVAIENLSEFFGDENQAREWLKRPNRVLQDVPPLEILGTDGGAVLVADELGRIESGNLY